MKLAFGVSYEEYWRIIPFAYERCCGKGWSNLLANIYGITFVGVYEIMAAVVARWGTHPKTIGFSRFSALIGLRGSCGARAKGRMRRGDFRGGCGSRGSLYRR